MCYAAISISNHFDNSGALIYFRIIRLIKSDNQYEFTKQILKISCW